MRPNLNLNEKCHSNILTLFRNGITQCSIILIIVTLIAYKKRTLIFQKKCFIFFNESPLKLMKNAF